MISYLFGAAGVFLFVAIAPLMQSAVRRAAWRVSPIVILAAAALFAHLATTLSGAVLLQSFRYWNSAAIFGFGAMAYVFAFGAVYKSVSLQILLNLTGQQTAALPLSAIVEGQIPEIFRNRIRVLLDSGLVVYDGNSFLTTSAGEQWSTRVGLIRRMFAIGWTGLYNFAPPPS